MAMLYFLPNFWNFSTYTNLAFIMLSGFQGKANALNIWHCSCLSLITFIGFVTWIHGYSRDLSSEQLHWSCLLQTGKDVHTIQYSEGCDHGPLSWPWMFLFRTSHPLPAKNDRQMYPDSFSVVLLRCHHLICQSWIMLILFSLDLRSFRPVLY